MNNCGDNASFTPAPSGGGGIGTLLHTESLGQISCSSSSAENLNKSIVVNNIDGCDLLLVEITADNKLSNHHISTVSMVLLTTNGTYYPDFNEAPKSKVTASTNRINYMKHPNGTDVASQQSAYGIYPNNPTISDGTITLPLWARYTESNTNTINDTYTTRVYGLNLYDLIS